MNCGGWGLGRRVEGSDLGRQKFHHERVRGRNCAALSWVHVVQEERTGMQLARADRRCSQQEQSCHQRPEVPVLDLGVLAMSCTTRRAGSGDRVTGATAHSVPNSPVQQLWGNAFLAGFAVWRHLLTGHQTCQAQDKPPAFYVTAIAREFVMLHKIGDITN